MPLLEMWSYVGLNEVTGYRLGGQDSVSNMLERDMAEIPLLHYDYNGSEAQ